MEMGHKTRCLWRESPLPRDHYWGFAGRLALALDPMSLVPRWRFMTDEAKALTKRSAVTAGVVVLVLLVFRALLPWALLAVVGWWIWKAVSR